MSCGDLRDPSDHRIIGWLAGMWQHRESWTAGLRWYPLTEGLTAEDVEEQLLLARALERHFVYDVRLQSYTETVDALSSDDLLVQLKTRHHHATDYR